MNGEGGRGRERILFYFLHRRRCRRPRRRSFHSAFTTFINTSSSLMGIHDVSTFMALSKSACSRMAPMPSMSAADAACTTSRQQQQHGQLSAAADGAGAGAAGTGTGTGREAAGAVVTEAAAIVVAVAVAVGEAEKAPMVSVVLALLLLLVVLVVVAVAVLLAVGGRGALVSVVHSSMAAAGAVDGDNGGLLGAERE